MYIIWSELYFNIYATEPTRYFPVGTSYTSFQIHYILKTI